jgi:hypothetical protein
MAVMDVICIAASRLLNFALILFHDSPGVKDAPINENPTSS